MRSGSRQRGRARAHFDSYHEGPPGRTGSLREPRGPDGLQRLVSRTSHAVRRRRSADPLRAARPRHLRALTPGSEEDSGSAEKSSSENGPGIENVSGSTNDPRLAIGGVQSGSSTGSSSGSSSAAAVVDSAAS